MGVTMKQMKVIHDDHKTYLKMYSTMHLKCYHICCKTHNIHVLNKNRIYQSTVYVSFKIFHDICSQLFVKVVLYFAP